VRLGGIGPTQPFAPTDPCEALSGDCGTPALPTRNSKCEIVISAQESCALSILPIIQWMSTKCDWPTFCCNLWKDI